jgi:hypothetical protein
LRWQTDLLLHDFAEKAWEICQTGGFSIRGELGTLSIGAVGDRILSTLRSSILGEKAVAGYQSPEPFTIVTVVEGLGPHPRADVKENDEVLRALEVVTNWPSDRKYFNLPDPGQVCLPLKQSAPPGSALYAQERGRAVWHPAMFRIENDANQAEQVDQNRRSSKLACYHRNLFFASLQTESLGRLITYTAREFASGRQKADLSDSHRNMAKNAALCLAKLYLGDKGNTWRSASMGRQIDQNFRKDLETVLAQFPVARLP